MAAIHILRLVALIATLLFSLIVLGLCAHILFLTTTNFDTYPIFAALGVATASMSLIGATVSLISGFVAKGAFPVLTVVELVKYSILWVLWLSTGALTADFYLRGFGGSCGFINDEVDMACKETAAIEAFSFLAWLTLMGYTITLLVFAIIGSMRGHRTWTASTLKANFLGPKGQSEKAQIDPQFAPNPSGNMGPHGQPQQTQYYGQPGQPQSPHQQQQMPMQQQYTGQTTQSQFSGQQSQYSQYPQQGMQSPQHSNMGPGQLPPSPGSHHPGVPQV